MSKALQNSQTKQPVAQPVFPKASPTSSGQSRHSTNEQTEKASKASIQAKTASSTAPVQLKRVETSKGTGEKRGSTTSSPSARREAHTDHQTAMPQREERGRGGQGGGNGGSFNSNHHKSVESQQMYMPPSAQLSHIRPRAESPVGSRSHHAGQHTATTRLGIQATFQNFVSNLVSSIFTRSPETKRMQTEYNKDRALKKQVSRDRMERDNLEKMARHQGVRRQTGMENKPLNGNPKLADGKPVAATSAQTTAAAPKIPVTSATQAASAQTAASMATRGGPSFARNGSIQRNAGAAPTSSSSKRDETPEHSQRLSVALAA